jgi:segregation and condensation protein B
MTNEPILLKQVIEALIFASEKPISTKEIISALKAAANGAEGNADVAQFGDAREADVREAVDALSADYAVTGRAFEVRETAGGFQLVTSATYGPWLRQLFPEAKPARMSAPAMETLAIIAYRQPLTRAGIEAVRGVAVDGVMQTLLDRGLVKIAGRADVPGRPLLYETTQFFMEHFGLRSLEELPNAAELRRAAEHAGKTAEEPSSAEPVEDREAELPLSGEGGTAMPSESAGKPVPENEP